jgi:crotonobetainyl-CoA:carnitine CoA-transferase CaiB-like acyl-CoA transferase
MENGQEKETLQEVADEAGSASSHSLKPETGKPGALDGLIVADFSRVLAGPYMTMLLGDLGATIIKVESPEGDSTRNWGPPWQDGESTYYKALNRNKHSIVLDLRQRDDLALAASLARRADVLVENFLPWRMNGFGLGYDTLAAQNPGLVYCSISGFGPQDGGALLPGYDLIAQAVGGLMSITGEEEGRPLKVGVAVVDVLCGLHAGLGILAALMARRETGTGQHVQVNLLSSVLSALTNQSAAYLMSGEPPTRLGNAHPSVAPYETFRVGDGDIVLAANTDKHFADLCEALDIPELPSDARFATNADRVANRLDLRAVIESLVGSMKRDDVIALLRKANLPCGPVNDIAEAFAFAESVGLESIWTLEGQSYVRTPIFLSESPAAAVKAPPQIGDSQERIAAWLRSSERSLT